MSFNRGKQFEQVFKQNWQKCFPNTFLLRLPDQLSGYYGSSNICDYIAYNNGKLYLLELKSHEGASIPFDAITQFEKLCRYFKMEGVVVGVILWLIEKDKVFFIPISTIKQMKAEGEKSVGMRHIGSKYKLYEIPSVKKRVFMESDYTILKNIQENCEDAT